MSGQQWDYSSDERYSSSSSSSSSSSDEGEEEDEYRKVEKKETIPQIKAKVKKFHSLITENKVDEVIRVLEEDLVVTPAFFTFFGSSSSASNSASHSKAAATKLFVNAKDEYGWSPLMKAAAFGADETLEVLLERGAVVNEVRIHRK